MPKPWTGALVGKMHNNGITYEMLAEELGIKKAYVSMILNSKREPVGIQEKMERAVEKLIAARGMDAINGAQEQ